MNKLYASKPILSPGRVDKFPPPLMRFLRSNASSKSRGKSRSSPMFVRKKNSAETQEPSSPKVTCMGQVRVTRSKQPSTTTPNRTGRKRQPTTKLRWKNIQIGLFFRQFAGKLKPPSLKPFWRKSVFVFQSSFRRKAKSIQELSQSESESEHSKDEEVEEGLKFFESTSSSPPRNALLLTRSRSAPYRSSSLAYKFWGEDNEYDRTEQQNRPAHEVFDKMAHPEPETREEELEFLKQLATSIEEFIVKSAKDQELNSIEEGFIRPLILTRCKSEPARTATEKLNLNGRLGFTD